MKFPLSKLHFILLILFFGLTIIPTSAFTQADVERATPFYVRADLFISNVQKVPPG